ncbi:beta-1,6-N-acetylglucosaminyltransferase [Salegentibacter salegens]|uniref:Peptide O-xylosyltransferase n=1 Tax=Salegentibacter salegens TaxID=143223 RepID=A0A1M7NFG0_9FLAO|nr:beta-1,6-N-acetylglucosaminyltransferase [Salegentibacter salegens]PRX46307.1 core-2/I-Branching enzyme [Salegentibacter salegens]SHN01984.1 Core-2/I-Branching enzyme [Salegentibacter salegens]
MTIHYIILAHKNPEQLERMYQRLNAPWVKFYIHVDRKVSILPFQSLLNKYENAYFLNDDSRENGTWGDIGIVKGTINALRIAVGKDNPGYYVLLSGQDYPLQKNETIKDIFRQNPEIDYITSYPLPHSSLDQGGIPRIEKYKVNKSDKRGHFLFLPSVYEKEFYSLETAGKINFLRKNNQYGDILRTFKRRRFPHYLKPYSGSQWWAMKEESIRYILNFLDVNPDYLKYHTYSLLPDEMFFQSIIQANGYKTKIESSKTYVNWEKTSGPLPVTFELNDFKELSIASKNHLFARKFDIYKDREILDEIDKKLLK